MTPDMEKFVLKLEYDVVVPKAGMDGILSTEKILDLYVNGAEAVIEGKIEY